MLPKILDRAGALPAVEARDRVPIEQGSIYVAPPDHHLLIERGRLRAVHGPRENRHRPAIDPLFRSAARSAVSCVCFLADTSGLTGAAIGPIVTPLS